MKNYEWDRRHSTGGNNSWQKVAALCMPRYRKTVYFYTDPEQLMQEGEITFGCLDAPEFIPAGCDVSLMGLFMGCCSITQRGKNDH